MESTTENKKSLTRHGDSEAPPTHPMRPEKNKVKPNPMTTYVNICNTKMQQRVIASPKHFAAPAGRCYQVTYGFTAQH